MKTLEQIFQDIRNIPEEGNNDKILALSLLRIIERKTFTFVSADIDSFMGEIVHKLADIADIQDIGILFGNYTI